MSWTVRAAIKSDADALMELGARLSQSDPFLVVDGFDPITGAALLKATLEEAHHHSKIFIAEHNKDLTGLAFCRRHPPPERQNVLQLDLAVDATQRGRGCGSALINHAVAWAIKSGVQRIQLAVVADNEPAIALYKKHHFSVEGRLRKSFVLDTKTHDVLVMARLLS